MPQTAQKEKLDSTELQGEFVSGGGRGHYASEILQGGTLDYLQPNFTADVQRRMRYDAEIESSVEFLIDSVFGDGVMSVAAITDEDHPEYAKAKEITDFVAAAVGTGDRTLEAVGREMFRGAFYSGCKAAEIVLKATGGNLIIDRINPKPNEAVGFVCDKFYNVIGMVGAGDNGAIPTNLKPDDERILAREKFFILQFELENNDPRGIAKIRAAFDAWRDKQDTRPDYKEWRRTSAIPKKVGIAPQNAKEIQLRGEDGQVVVKNNIPQTITVEKALMGALEGFANNSTVTAPFGTDIKQLEVNGTGTQFTTALKFNNSEIRKAVLGDSVSTGEDDKGVKAAKETSMNVVDLRVVGYKNAFADAVERDVFCLLTVLNFGEDCAHLTPRANLGDTERRDWATDLDAAAGGGYQFAPEHLPELDVQFGLKPRKELPEAKAAGDAQNAENKSADEQNSEGDDNGSGGGE